MQLSSIQTILCNDDIINTLKHTESYIFFCKTFVWLHDFILSSASNLIDWDHLIQCTNHLYA